MLRATILRTDDSILLEHAEIEARRAKRGLGDGQVWRGVFALPHKRLRPTIGENIHLQLEDDARLVVVVTEIEGPLVHFRARGQAPDQSRVTDEKRH